MSDVNGLLDAAREAFDQREWVAARDGFRAAERVAGTELPAEDEWAAANASWWLGDLDDALTRFARAHHGFLGVDRRGDAALAGLEVAYALLLRGDEAQANGWLRIAQRLLAALPEGPEHGYLDYVTGFEVPFAEGRLDEAARAAARVRVLGERHADPTLCALAGMAEGRVRLRRGETAVALRLLDEAMVAAASDTLDPGWTGNIYCHLMTACEEIADVRRAGEWTAVTARWCESMPGAGPFMGICRVHRAQVLQLQGELDRAEREVRRVATDLVHFDLEAVAQAHYLLGELRRQVGDLAGAEAAYLAAHRLGRDPQPGLALLRLARGQVEAALAALRVVLAASADPPARAAVLPALVEVAVAAGALDLAQEAAVELAGIAAHYATSGLEARAATCQGMVALVTGDPATAAQRLRHALACWQAIEAPYDVARVRVLLAETWAALGDEDAARRERALATSALARLGARWQWHPPPPAALPAGLTTREAEVLAHVVAGRSNAQIAERLVLSVRTVERHLASIYEKVGVRGRSARAGAVAFALGEGMAAAP